MNLDKKIRKEVIIIGILLTLIFSVNLFLYKFSYKARNDINEKVNIIRNSSGNTWTVDDDGPSDFSTIQDAVNVAASGDTIFVYPGTYAEGSILIGEGITLDLNPGVILRFSTTNGLAIYGQLIAKGSEAEPIIFTSNQSSPVRGDWVGIVFTDSSIDAVFDEDGNHINGSIMQYCIVEYGGESSTPAIKIISSSPFIDHCIIKYNAYSGIYIQDSSLNLTNNIISNNSAYDGGGINIQSSVLTIKNNTISFNSAAHVGGGIFSWASTTTIIDNNIIYNSAYYTGGGIGYSGGNLNIEGNIISYNSVDYKGGGFGNYEGGATMTINGNIISNNIAGTGGGIYLSDWATFINNSIINNTAGTGGGISLSGRGATFIKNKFINNTAHDDGGGIYLIGFQPSEEVFFYSNDIINNYASIGKGGGIYVTGLPIISYNNIYNNTPYDIYNSNPLETPVNATNNWWGTTNVIEIQEHIYDWYDDASLGIVAYTPYTDGTKPILTSPADITYNEGSTGNEIIWTANDLNPTTYSITNNSVEFESGTWIDGQVFTIDIDGLFYGTYTFNITVYDIDGNCASDIVIVTIVGGTNPTLTNPADISYNEGSTGNEIVWTANDLNPDSYSITNNTVEFDSGTWVDGQTFTVDVDGLSCGTYTFNITVVDIDGNSVSDIVIVTVVDGTFPTLTSPADITFNEGDTGNEIAWTANDLNPATYSITKDGTEIEADNWVDGQTFTVDVDGLSYGTYTYVITVYDVDGNFAMDTVIVNV
ncbi:hypothetical protein LCGC14_1946560, partial [marine sediment metagenome]